jgi:hypothetical protein
VASSEFLAGNSLPHLPAPHHSIPVYVGTVQHDALRVELRDEPMLRLGKLVTMDRVTMDERDEQVAFDEWRSNGP